MISDVPIKVTWEIDTLARLCDIIDRSSQYHASQQLGVKVVLAIDGEVTTTAYPGLDLFGLVSRAKLAEIIQFDGESAVLWEEGDWLELEWFTAEAHFWLRAYGGPTLEDLGRIVASTS